LFLAITANQNYWKTDGEILFLGEWCMAYDQQHVWSKLDHEILPSHWDEREKLDEHCIYLESIYEKYLKNLASSLNSLHGENHSLRYWRILLGPWLIFFIEIIYDRYLSIQSAIDSNKVTNTWIPPFESKQYMGLDILLELSSKAKDNNFNLYLYSRIITRLGKIPFEYKEDESYLDKLGSSETKSLPLPDKIKIASKKLLKNFSKLTPEIFNQIVFSASGLSNWNQVKLQLSLGQIPYFAPPDIISGTIEVKEEIRKSLKLPQAINEFESILSDLIIEQLPTSFLEGYLAKRDKSLEAFPENPKVIFTSNDSWFNESFKFWAATQVEQGAKLILAQHGGGYGMIGPLTVGNHELEICDKYFTLGWTLKDQPKIVPMTGGKLQGAQYNIKPESNGAILLVAVSWPLYFVHMDHVICGFNGTKYILRQARLLKFICHEVAKLLLVRFPNSDDGLNKEKRFADISPSIKIYNGVESMCNQLQNSRLCIHDYLGTTSLETLSMNFPTVIYWDPKSVNMLKSTQPYLDELRRVRILHDTPESAARLVNEIYEDPISWWSSSDIQEVRKKFCHQFARTSDKWLTEWKEELLKIADKQ
jgi:putative transferase (TIGR04331 family)